MKTNKMTYERQQKWNEEIAHLSLDSRPIFFSSFFSVRSDFFFSFILWDAKCAHENEREIEIVCVCAELCSL